MRNPTRNYTRSPSPPGTRIVDENSSANTEDVPVPSSTCQPGGLLDTGAGGCVPTHRSVFRLFRKKNQQPHRRTMSNASGMMTREERLDPAHNHSVASSGGSEHLGYLRANRRVPRIMSLSAQRTRSELAIAGPIPQPAASIVADSSTSSNGKLSARDMQPYKQPRKPSRMQKPAKGTIVQLSSSPSKQVAIPSVEDIHPVNPDFVESLFNNTSAIEEEGKEDNANKDTEADTGAKRGGKGKEPATGISTPESAIFTTRQSSGPRRSLSSADVGNIRKHFESNRTQQKQNDEDDEEEEEDDDDENERAASEDELITTTAVNAADMAIQLYPDDGSDWNSDFSSPTSWRKSNNHNHLSISRRVSRPFDSGSRLKDRAIDRSVLEAQQKILEQEKYLMQISNLSSELTSLRPSILRCLVFELPERWIQVGTSTFISNNREPCGSLEPSVEEERLWELWRQAEALLTIMDNDNVPMNSMESRLSLSKKRAIMLAFCDWEQYALYVQDAWDKARKGIQQPTTERDSRRSSSHSVSGNNSAGVTAEPSRRESYADSLASTTRKCQMSPSCGNSALTRFSLTKQRRMRRRSVVGVAPASLQRIANEAQSIKYECELLLDLMSPMYRESMQNPSQSAGTITSNSAISPQPMFPTSPLSVSAISDPAPTSPVYHERPRATSTNTEPPPPIPPLPVTTTATTGGTVIDDEITNSDADVRTGPSTTLTTSEFPTANKGAA